MINWNKWRVDLNKIFCMCVFLEGSSYDCFNRGVIWNFVGVFEHVAIVVYPYAI